MEQKIYFLTILYIRTCLSMHKIVEKNIFIHSHVFVNSASPYLKEEATSTLSVFGAISFSLYNICIFPETLRALSNLLCGYRKTKVIVLTITKLARH